MLIGFATRIARAQSLAPDAAKTEVAYWGAVATLTLFGAALRLRGADGDLWLDEIWTLNLLEQAGSLSDVFLRIHHDNNHFLNSAWLWLIGAEAPARVMRLAAIVCGISSVPAAAAVGRLFCDASGLAAAALVAGSYFFVHYGSEARGYAGMLLAILLAYRALEEICKDPTALGPLVAFGLAICFGAWMHLTMVEATGALCLTAFARLWGQPAYASRSGVVGGVAVLASVPAVGCFIFGALSPDFKVGAMVPFSLEILAEGLAGMVRSVFGLGGDFSDAVVVIATAALALALLAIVPAERRWFPATAIFALPLLHALAALPSQQYPRFHATAAVGLVLLAADGFAVLWRREGLARGIGIIALGSMAAGSALQLATFFRDGRGRYADAVRLMGETCPATYAVDFAKGETKAVVAYYSARLGVRTTPVGDGDWCNRPPTWLISVRMPGNAQALAERRTLGVAPCSKSFVRGESFPAWGLSGFTWTLYRRED